MTKLKTPKIEELFDAGVHIGHQARRWHPKMEPYLFTSQNKVHVFDLEQTENLLKEACEYLYETAKKGSQIIFVGTKRQASETVKEAAKKSGALYVTERWLGGTITNFRMIKKNMEKLVTYIKQREEGILQKYTKKERLLIDREIEKLEKYVGGLVSLKGSPGAIVVVDPKKEKTAVREALRTKIGVVALIDSNSDPSDITYPVPGNDDAIKSISLIMSAFGDAVEAGYKEFGKIADKALSDLAAAAKIVEPSPTEVKPLTISVDTKDPAILDEVIADVALSPISDVVALPIEVKDTKKKPAVKKAKEKEVKKKK